MEKAEMVNVNPAVGNPPVGNGSAGLETQVGNQPVTVSGAAAATGGVGAGNFIEPDIDEELFQFSSDDTPIMNLMLKAKKVTVNSSEVDHYSLDEPTAMVTVTSVNGQKLTLDAVDTMKLHAYDTLVAKEVKGYVTTEGTNGGVTNTKSNKPLMLFVTSIDDDGQVNVKALNGVKTSVTDEYGTLPNEAGNTIANGSKLIVLGNALYETQKFVDPDMVLPKPERIYLQKRGMNSIVSDYFESQKKRIPFSKALIAEAEIRNFKVKGNRTLLISLPSKFRVKSRGLGDMQYVYTTTGVRWQVKREVEHRGRWTYEDFISLAKLFYTGEDVPESCIGLCGKNFMEGIQSIDWSKHPEVKIEVKNNQRLGWKVTAITTIFGEFQFKREPTFDRVGYENCALLLGENRLVHYQRKAETNFNEKVEGEEATRKGILVFDALALKGSCHIWVDGKGDETAPGATEYVMYSGSEAPTDPVDGAVYMFQNSLTIAVGDSDENDALDVKAGEMYKYTTKEGWKKYIETTVAAA